MALVKTVAAYGQTSATISMYWQPPASRSDKAPFSHWSKNRSSE